VGGVCDENKTSPKMQGAAYQISQQLLVFLVFTIILISTTVTVVFPPETVRDNDLLTPAPPVTYSTVTTVPLTTTSTLTSTTPPATNTTPPVTTPPVPPVTIMCPPDVTVTLGFSLDSTYTGGVPVAGGGCTLPGPIVTYVDTVTGIISKRSGGGVGVSGSGGVGAVKRHPQPHAGNPASWALQTGSRVLPTLLTYGDEDDDSIHSFKRSPSFNATHTYTLAQRALVSGALRPDDTAAAGIAHVVWLANQPTGGALVTVTDKDLVLDSSFLLGSLGAGNCSAANARGQAHVVWDYEARVWVALELSGGDRTLVCVYISNGADPTDTWDAYQYAVPISDEPYFAPYPLEYAKVAVWGRTYAFTFSLAPAYVGDNPKSLCVWERELALNRNASAAHPITYFNSTTNATTVLGYTTDPLPRFFCGAPFYQLLPGFLGGGGAPLNTWTPVHAEGAAPPSETESSGASTPGALFMRAIDDEYHYGASSPTVDQIEVEHWYNLNFTASSYNAIRYKVAVSDFRANSCNATTNACIPTPASYALDSMNGPLMPRLQYRYIPATGQQSIVAALTSHAEGATGANGTITPSRVQWVELRWLVPAPMTAPLWRLFQQGVVGGAGGAGEIPSLHRWMPSAAMDGNGTIVMVYAGSSGTTYPSLLLSSRLGNDPVNQMRAESVLVAGAVGSSLASTSQWGRTYSVSTDPVSEKRIFYVSGDSAVISDPWQANLLKIRVRGEVLLRYWTAQDYCGHSAVCVQAITCV
jgi:hypothetical protein